MECLNQLFPANSLQNLVANLANYKDEEKHVILQNFLRGQFRNRRDDFIENSKNSIYQEAKEIADIFPNLAPNYILEQLKLFIDLPNRLEVVLRQLIYAKECDVSDTFSLNDNKENITTPSGSELSENLSQLEAAIETQNHDVIGGVQTVENSFKENDDHLKFINSNMVMLHKKRNFNGDYNDDPYLVKMRKIICNSVNQIVNKSNEDVPETILINSESNNKISNNTCISKDKFHFDNRSKFLGGFEISSEPSTSKCHTGRTKRRKWQIQVDGEQEAIKNEESLDTCLVIRLCQMFPDADRHYIENLCIGKKMCDEHIDDILTIILDANDNYPKKIPKSLEPEMANLESDEQLDILKNCLADADPDYLIATCARFRGDPIKLQEFLNDALEKRDYPTFKDYQRRQQVSAQMKQYTTEFNVANFIQLIPNPISTFTDPQRTYFMDYLSTDYALAFLKNSFRKLPSRTIAYSFRNNSSKLYNTFLELNTINEQKNTRLKSIRKMTALPQTIQNIPLLQEIAFVSHELEILNYMNEQCNEIIIKRKLAKENGLMKTCVCCYDEEVMPDDVVLCSNSCLLCKTCINKFTEIKLAEGIIDIACPMNCSTVFSLHQLQKYLPPKLFSKIAQKKAVAEVTAAGFEDLETCPFCDFATIPAEGDKLFRCLNEECMKESCRLCKESNHIPLRCDEVEKDEQVKARVFIENQMTEALLRKCYKCGIKFYKEEGCNKMTCSCGAMMCYICGKPVKSYKHFNGLGGDKYSLCPLYSDNIQFNEQKVLKAAKQAKNEIKVDLKSDPTTNIKEHYKERAKMFPKERYPRARQ